MKLIFENEYWAVVDKPGGILSVPSRMGESDPRQVLGLQLQKLLTTRIFPVHRLDFEVSGLILFAKTALAHKEASKWFEKKQVEKCYLAYSDVQDFSHWPSDLPMREKEIQFQPGQSLNWKCQIMKGKKRSFESPHGDLAETTAKMDQKIREFNQWLLFPHTGRSHQLRFEMSRHGFSILGDTLYGSRIVGPVGNIALRSIGLSFGKIDSKLRMGLPGQLELPKLIPEFLEG